jgi:hypothetical protein
MASSAMPPRNDGKHRFGRQRDVRSFRLGSRPHDIGTGGRFVRRAEVLDRALDRPPLSPLNADEPLAAK